MKNLKVIITLSLLLLFAIWIGGAFLSESHMQSPDCHNQMMPTICPVIQYSASLWQQLGFTLTIVFLLVLLVFKNYFKNDQSIFINKSINFFKTHRRYFVFQFQPYMVEIYSSGIQQPKIYR
jgi:hypothetical protein